MPVASWFTEPNERAAVALTLGCALAAVGCGGSDASADEGAPRGWQDRFIYQILVDRFEDGDPSNNVRAGVGVEPDDLSRHQGGDWVGVTQRLDYVKRLGAGAIWISPIVRNVDRTETEDGYHGYWAEDFTEVNPRYGTLDELQELVRQAHARDLRVIIDVVTNHAGRVFNYDLDGDGQLDEGEVEPPYRSQPYDVPLLWGATRPNLYRNGERWELGAAEYRRRGFGGYVGEGRVYGDFGTGLRDLDTENQEVFDALLETYVRWVELTDVDGFRIDAVPHIEDSYWAEFCRRLRTELAARGKRDFMLLGEVFEQQAAQLARFTGEDELDSVFDFPFKFSFIDQVVLGGRRAGERSSSFGRKSRDLGRSAAGARHWTFFVERSSWLCGQSRRAAHSFAPRRPVCDRLGDDSGLHARRDSGCLLRNGARLRRGWQPQSPGAPLGQRVQRRRSHVPAHSAAGGAAPTPRGAAPRRAHARVRQRDGSAGGRRRRRP